MSQVDKIKVGSISYDIAQASTATFAGTSYDVNTTSATAWDSNIDTNPLSSTAETNASIFIKMSRMFKNIRFLYNQLGTTDYSATGSNTITGALANLQSNKAALSHSHTVKDLPVNDQQSSSSDTIPTSSLIYSMNSTLNNVNEIVDVLTPEYFTVTGITDDVGNYLTSSDESKIIILAVWTNSHYSVIPFVYNNGAANIWVFKVLNNGRITETDTTVYAVANEEVIFKGYRMTNPDRIK